LAIDRKGQVDGSALVDPPLDPQSKIKNQIRTTAPRLLECRPKMAALSLKARKDVGIDDPGT
jgi:hypothetical protein